MGMTIKDYFDELADEKIIEACKDSEAWKQTGRLPGGELMKFIEWGEHIYNERDLEDYMLKEALRRFGDVVSILLKNFLREFVK